MKERTVVISFDSGEVGITLGANFLYFYTPIDLTVIFASAAPSVDDSGATITLNDDGSATSVAPTCADQNVPGTWKSTHMGGTNAPVFIAAGSLCSLTAAGTAAGTRISMQIWALTGEFMT